jgi:trimeric autotransporter adhesin
VSPSVVASGDTLSIRGIAAGQPENNIAVWILGTNKVIYLTPSVNTDGTFEQEISKARTGDMAAGQYFVVVQHPMYNQVFDIWPVSSVAGFNNNDLVAGSYPVQGNTLFRLQGEGSLQGPDAAEALVQALNDPAIDDIYAKLQFLVEVPAITLFPVPEKMVGDTFTISGTTNLAINDTILVEVTSSSFKPTTKSENGEFGGASGTVTVRKGTDGLNRWSFPVNASTFKPDEYLVLATGLTVNAQASGHFNVVEFNQATHRTIPPDEEIQEEPDTGITDTVTANTSADDEGDSDSSGFISVNTKASKLARVIESRPTPVPTPVTTSVEEVNETGTDTIIPSDTALPTARPTVQPGFGALITLAGLCVVVFRLGRRH